MRAVAVWGLLACLGAGPAGAATLKTPPMGCASFMQDFTAAATAYRASFERPLTIRRGFGGEEEGVEVRVLSTNADVEGTLKCRGDIFLRFELRIATPAKERTLTDFDAFARVSLAAALRYDGPRATAAVRTLAADAAEYLKASQQRGDIYVSGRTETHGPDKLDLGMLWTETDRTFVITSQKDE